MKRPAVKMRVRVFEPLRGALMVTSYSAQRAGETGHVGFVPYGPLKPTRPGGSAPG